MERTLPCLFGDRDRGGDVLAPVPRDRDHAVASSGKLFVRLQGPVRDCPQSLERYVLFGPLLVPADQDSVNARDAAVKALRRWRLAHKLSRTRRVSPERTPPRQR